MTATIGLLCLGATMVTRGRVGAEESLWERRVRDKTTDRVFEEHTDSLLALTGVVGTSPGLCSGEAGTKVFVVAKTDQLLEQIPAGIDGNPVNVGETGEFRKLIPG